jgi:type VI secretion system secreted protein VgrG
MPIERVAAYDVVFMTDGLEAGILQPRRISAVEGMSRAMQVVVDMVMPAGDLNVPAMLRKGAEVVFYSRDTKSVVRRFAGIVTSVRERARGIHGGQEVTVTFESPMAILERSTDFAINLDKSTKDIVSALLVAAGISKVDWKLSSPPPKREICTQYGERTSDFVARLLEEDGIFWYVDQKDDGPTIVFGDASSSYGATIPSSIRFMEETGMVADDAITSIVERASLRPGKVTLRDHDFKNPPLDSSLEVNASKTSPFDREHYEYPGRYVTPGEGSRRAKIRLDAFDADATTLEVVGHVPGVAAGHVFSLTDTPGSAFDGDWVAVRVAQSWEQSETEASVFETRATLIPKTQVFRPLALTPKPRALPCTALVRCPSGEEIHCDEFGRIRLSFIWDRYGAPDEKTSGWARVGQMHTSGSVVIPRSGWEVLVDFEDGDPDKPIVLGRLYNAKDPPAQPLPQAKTTSMLRSFSTPGGGGHNEISMHDGGGKEQIALHAQKDMNLVVANNKDQKITTNATFGVVADEQLTVGANQTVKVGAKDAINVGGAQTWSVGAVRSKTVSGDEGYDVKGSRSVTIGAVHMTSTPKSDSLSTSGSLSETVGGVYLATAALGSSIATAGSCSILVGGAKIEAVAAGKGDTTLGARASTIGGALLNLSGKDVSVAASAVKATTVGGAWTTSAAGKAEISSKAALTINVGGALSMNGTTVILKVGGSSITVAGGAVVVSSENIKLTASGPNAEAAPMVGSK